jgi:hypothetical protein
MRLTVRLETFSNLNGSKKELADDALVRSCQNTQKSGEWEQRWNFADDQQMQGG